MLSVIIAVKDELDNVDPLALEINEVFAGLPMDWEVLWIDDGSKDGTIARLKEIHRQNPSRHRFVIHRGNFGKSAAVMTGLARARGEIIATLDGDCQNDPADIPRLLKMMEEGGFDVVTGFRQRRNDNFIRKMSSRIGNGFRNIITGHYVRDAACAIRVFKAETVQGIPWFEGMHRFIVTLIYMNGFKKIAEVPVNHRPRIRGEAKYGIRNRLLVGLIDTFFIRWYKQRQSVPDIQESSD